MLRICLILLSLLFIQPVKINDEIVYAEFEGLQALYGITLTSLDNQLHAVARGLWNDEADPQLVYLTSTDAGRHWKLIARISQANDPPILSKGPDSIRLAIHGAVRVVVWRSQGEMPGTGELTLAYSLDQGHTWQRGQNPAIGDTSHNQSYPDIILDDQGKTHLVWLDDREEQGNTQGLRYAESRDYGAHWLPEKTLDKTTCTCCWIRLTLLPDQTLAVLYRGSEPHDMKMILDPDGLGQWASARVVGQFDWYFSGCPHCGGGLLGTPSESGIPLLHSAVWTGKEGMSGLYYLRSSDGGSHWPLRIKIADQNSRNPDLAALDVNHLGLIFTGPLHGTQTLQFTRSDDAGMSWSLPVVISRNNIRIESPRILVLHHHYSVFWTEKNADGNLKMALRKID